MEEIEIFELLKEAYGGPLNIFKWLIVLAFLVMGYIMAMPVYKKVSYFLSWERKRDIALSRGHVIKAHLVSSYYERDNDSYSYVGKYEYILNGERKIFRGDFVFRPDETLELYYLKNPKRVFTPIEYHYENHKAVIILPIVLFPWILAIVVAILLKVEYMGKIIGSM